MMRQNSSRLKLLTYGVIAYMCVAFAWWSILLYTKNDDAFRAKVDTLRLVMVAEGTYGTEQQFRQSEAYNSLEQRYSRQEWMILGEAGFFMVSIILGVWIISRSYSNLIKTSEEKRNFLLSITHELKSPITSARLGLETIQKRDLEKDKVNMIATNSMFELDRLKTLVDNLLLAAKVDSKYQPLFERIDMHVLIRDQVQRLLGIHKDISIELDLHEDARFADIDRNGFQSILINLLENAIKYSADTKKLNVKATSINDELAIKIADNGIGIPDEEKQKIFDKFYRVGSEDTRKTKGTGLGLYIVKQLVQVHGGRIKVDDNQPQGTVFTVIIPQYQN